MAKTYPLKINTEYKLKRQWNTYFSILDKHLDWSVAKHLRFSICEFSNKTILKSKTTFGLIFFQFNPIKIKITLLKAGGRWISQLELSAVLLHSGIDTKNYFWCTVKNVSRKSDTRFPASIFFTNQFHPVPGSLTNLLKPFQNYTTIWWDIYK